MRRLGRRFIGSRGGITLAILAGLCWGCDDAVVPDDSADTRVRIRATDMFVPDARPDTMTIEDCTDGEERPCGVDRGLCQPGIQRCIQQLWTSECIGSIQPQNELCNGLDDDCDGNNDEGFGVGNGCKTTDDRNQEIGGVWACDPETGDVYCAAFEDCQDDVDGDGVNVCQDCDDDDRQNFPGNPERCDNADNDCDMVIDEGFNLDEICYAGEGICRRGGRTVCDQRGVGIACDAEPGPPAEQELCADNEDNDCDGFIDEGFDIGIPCADGVGACQRGGVTQCSDDGTVVLCDAVPGDPVDEICGNGIDDDCDGRSDEGYASGDVCFVGVGACARRGTLVCNADGSDVVCNVVAGEAMPEICGNRLDDDCDGVADEGFDVGADCADGVGGCARRGVEVCNPAGDGTLCSAVAGDPVDEVCGDGIDNDCDLVTDEGYDVGAACEAGVGLCHRTGSMICTPEGDDTVCSITAGQAAPERCDNLDNDCDGAADEGFELGEPCAVGFGLCENFGQLRCDPGGLTNRCDALPFPPQAELCDEIDNDCDGNIDETYVLLGEPCDSADPDLCARGVYQCNLQTRDMVCADDIPSPEVCNYLDDDCDDVVDNGIDFLNDPANCGACGEACDEFSGRCVDGTCFTTYWVDANEGSDFQGLGSRESPWRTISRAMAAVDSPRSTINVMPGRYAADMHPQEMEVFPIRVLDGVQIVGFGQPLETIIDPMGAAIAFLVRDLGDEGLSMERLYIQRGGIFRGGSAAIEIYNSDFVLRDVYVTGSETDLAPAALHIEGGNVLVDHCTFDNNESRRTRAIVGVSQGANVTISRSHFRHNIVGRPDENEAIVQSISSRLRVENSVFVENSGNAVLSNFNDAVLEVAHNSFAFNDGSGVRLAGELDATIVNNIFSHNQRFGIIEDTDEADPVVVEGNMFFENIAGVYFDEGQTALDTTDTLNAVIQGAAQNYSGDPAYISLASGNLRLRAESAAIDRAVEAHVLPVDQDNFARPHGNGADVGAFEMRPDLLNPEGEDDGE